MRARWLALIALLGALLTSGAARAAFEPLSPDPFRSGKSRPAVAIGEPGKMRDYYRIDRDASPFTLEGPGTLRMLVRADIPSGMQSPDSVWVSLEGLTGFPIQRWGVAVHASKLTAYADGRRSRTTTAARITLVIPLGRHEVRVGGLSDIGEKVYASFGYERITRPPAAPAPEEETE